MSIQIVEAERGFVTVNISGKLKQVELAGAQKKLGQIIRRRGKVKILALGPEFQGWEEGGKWDLMFQGDNDSSIEKMAIVVPKQWEDLALLFAAKDLRKFPIEYFAPADVDKARSWLGKES